MTHKQLARAMRLLIFREWVDQDPSEKCFDYSEERMDLLLRFKGDSTDDAEDQDIKSHLIYCARCRFIYAILRAVKAWRGETT